MQHFATIQLKWKMGLTGEASLYASEYVSTINTGLSLGSGLTCCLLSLCGGRSTMVALYVVQLLSSPM